VDGRASGGNPQIAAVRMLIHAETGNTFPNGQTMGGVSHADYPPITANINQAQINADFAPTGWTSVNTDVGGLNTRNVTLFLSEPITTRYIRLGITNVATSGDNSFTQVSEIRVFGDGEAPPPVKHTVTFNSNGGSPVSSITQSSQGASIVLPATTREGYTFKGWWTQTDCQGTLAGYVGASYTPSNDVTLFACWQKNEISESDCNGVPRFGEAGRGAAGTVQVVYDGKLWKSIVNNAGWLEDVCDDVPEYSSFNSIIGQAGEFKVVYEGKMYENAVDMQYIFLPPFNPSQWTLLCDCNSKRDDVFRDEHWELIGICGAFTNIVEILTDNNLKIYPNPIVNGTFFVERTFYDNQPERIKIYDITGKLVLLQQTAGTKTEINISHLPDGFYVVNVGEVSAKIVKQ
jgi:uncharacterized repeat protein (TIGR02543 family)